MNTSLKDSREKYEYPPENSPPPIDRERLVEIVESERHVLRPRIWATMNRVKDDHANHQ
jgi:hypothetical protein